LGGGPAALGAAWELTSSAGWQSLYEVTVYQMGWRLGGKCSTGRGPGNRVEEHGIHVLQGFYHNTFAILGAALPIYHRLFPDSPLGGSFDTALTRADTTLFSQFSPRDGWLNWPFVFPRNSGVPGTGDLGFLAYIQQGVRMLLDLVFNCDGSMRLPAAEALGELSRWTVRTFDQKYGRAARGDMPTRARQMTTEITDVLSVDALRGQGLSILDDLVKLLKGLLDLILSGLRDIVEDRMAQPRQTSVIYRAAVTVELLYVAIRGIFFGGVFDWRAGTFDWEKIDGMDFRAWLGKNGASSRLVHSTLVRFFYTATLSNLVDGQGGGQLSARAGVLYALLVVNYQGSWLWFMNSGTGDTLIMPIYQALKERGVKFSWFSEVTEVHDSTTGDIEALTIARQVDLKVAEYTPWITIEPEAGGSMPAWPAHPRYEQIVDAQSERLQSVHTNLENPYSGWTPAEVRTLRKGADFDHIILAIPIAAIPGVCPGIIETHPRWSKMVATMRTTATQSVQLWFKKTLDELGFHRKDWGLPAGAQGVNATAYASPLPFWVDYSMVIPFEGRSKDPPKFLCYTGGPIDAPEMPVEPGAARRFQEVWNARTYTTTRQWLYANTGFYWPAATTLEYPAGLDLDLLVRFPDGEGGTGGNDAYESQFFTARVIPWERYTLPYPGTNGARLAPDDTDFGNLFVAGDWTNYGVNAGFIEGAVQSGLLAARGLLQRFYPLVETRPASAEARTA
jgi:uncharacterized protein with NAD-binding domain and iron-sulfur cluster